MVLGKTLESPLDSREIKPVNPKGSESEVAQSCPTLCDPIDQQPTRLLCPWDSPVKNTGVGCHFLLQCMKVKSESEVTQWCPTFCDPMDYSLSGSPSMGFSRQEYWSGLPFPSPGDLPYPGIEPGSPALQADSLPTEPLGEPSI